MTHLLSRQALHLHETNHTTMIFSHSIAPSVKSPSKKLLLLTKPFSSVQCHKRLPVMKLPCGLILCSLDLIFLYVRYANNSMSSLEKQSMAQLSRLFETISINFQIGFDISIFISSALISFYCTSGMLIIVCSHLWSTVKHSLE